jgi:DNA-3-methyladenine glycosylase II
LQHLPVTESNLPALCDILSRRDKELREIIRRWGYPPLWDRPPGFATLVHVLLEQQVSLASARAALTKLKEKIGQVTAERIMELSDDELKSCYFSRQKTSYARHLAEAILSKKLDLTILNSADDETVRKTLTSIKGIGNWTVDVYLLMALGRPDIFPIGDLALVKSLRRVKELPLETGPEAMLQVAQKWRPYRSVASRILWHAYLEQRPKKS